MTIQETVADRLSGGKITELTEVTGRQGNEIMVLRDELRESMQRLEQMLYAPGWQRLGMEAEKEFSRNGMREITKLARIMRLKNPIIKRGVDVQRLYVWAQGVSISVEDETINEAIQTFMQDERNRAGLTSHQSYGNREVSLQTDGNLFFRFFVDEQKTGRVRVRTMEPNEIEEIITNPEDDAEPWLYHRIWNQTDINGKMESLSEYYPDFRFVPKEPAAIDAMLGKSINWDTPVYHVAVNKLGNWGISEFYAALDWALAYKNFLEQLASVWSALARWAAKLTTKGGARGVAAAKTKLNTTVTSSTGETNPSPIPGSTFIASEGVDLQPFRTAGATMSAEDGRRLLLQTVAVFGLPETFFGDVSVGTLATAKSLDRPTELMIADRQELWKSIISDILNYALMWAVKAPQGPLNGAGKYVRIDDGDEWIERIEWPDDVDATIKVSFPPIVEEDVAGLVNAVIDSATMKGAGQGIPMETAVRELLGLLGISDVDAVMELWREEEEERAANAEKLAQQFSQNGQGAPDEEEETEADRVLVRVNQLIADIGEAVNDV